MAQILNRRLFITSTFSFFLLNLVSNVVFLTYLCLSVTIHSVFKDPI